jgi:hypothetical protein
MLQGFAGVSVGAIKCEEAPHKQQGEGGACYMACQQLLGMEWVAGIAQQIL